MKATIVTLIVVGAFLILTPIVAGSLQEAHQVKLMEKPGVTATHLSDSLIIPYRFACWLTGTAMIAASVYLAIRLDRQVPNA